MRKHLYIISKPTSRNYPFCFFRKILLSSLFFILVNSTFAQECSVISAGGGLDHTANISLEWTLGELAVESLKVNNGSYTEGFHQPQNAGNKSVLAKTSAIPDYRFSISPNPATTELNVSVDKLLLEKVSLQLTDQSGKAILSLVPSYNRSFKIFLKKYPVGTYYLFIRDERGQLLKTLPVIILN